MADLIRTSTSDHGTEGILLTEGLICHTLEPPWRDNQRSISCIPVGEYDVVLRYSQKYKHVYWVTEVDGRSWILIHSGNFGGDTSKGFKTHTNGCILLGKSKGYIGDQRAILNSRITIRKFMNVMGNEPFKLEVIELC